MASDSELPKRTVSSNDSTLNAPGNAAGNAAVGVDTVESVDAEELDAEALADAEYERQLRGREYARLQAAFGKASASAPTPFLLLVDP